MKLPACNEHVSLIFCYHILNASLNLDNIEPKDKSNMISQFSIKVKSQEGSTVE